MTIEGDEYASLATNAQCAVKNIIMEVNTAIPARATMRVMPDGRAGVVAAPPPPPVVAVVVVDEDAGRFLRSDAKR
jgi:hypothetical protein